MRYEVWYTFSYYREEKNKLIACFWSLVDAQAFVVMQGEYKDCYYIVDTMDGCEYTVINEMELETRNKM